MTNPWPQPNTVPAAPRRPWWKKKRFAIPLGILAFFVGVALVSPDPEPKATAVADTSPSTRASAGAATKAVASAEAPPEPKATPKPVAPKLSQQDKFIALIETARDAADDADNDFQKRLPLTKRDKAICKLLKTKRVQNWTGEIENLDTNGDGLGVLTIQIADDVKVSTWNNALSDFEDNTLIKTSSPLFDTMSTLNEGDQVTFSGTFTRDPESCIGEQSVTDNGATQTPTFTMRFTKLERD